jgi:Amino acid transporters
VVLCSREGIFLTRYQNTTERERWNPVEQKNTKKPEPMPHAPSGLRSEHVIPRIMPRILGTQDMTATFVLSTYLASYASTAVAGGPAAITYLLLVGCTFFLPSLIATAQLGYLFPCEGALYNWTHRAVGGYWGFFSGFCAWLPGILITGSMGNLLLSYGQSLIGPLPLAPWVQGVIICSILLFGCFVSTQRFRSVQQTINIIFWLLLISVGLIALAAIVWLLTGHQSATDFSDWSSWSMQPGNIVLYGLLSFAYIGTEGPLNMAGEMTSRSVVKRHLLRGSLILIAAYLTNTLAVLIVMGRNAADNPFALVTTVDIVLGKGIGLVTALCLMGTFFGTILIYNYLYARLLLVAGLDRRLPSFFAHLNERHVPAHAILFQTALSVIITLLTFVMAPIIAFFGNAADFSIQMYNIGQAAAAIVWTISTIFLFISLAMNYVRNPQGFLAQRIFPLPVIWFSVLCGPLSCLFTIASTLLFPWTGLVPNTQWWYLVGGLTLIFLIVASGLSIFARSEVEWQSLQDVIAHTPGSVPLIGAPAQSRLSSTQSSLQKNEKQDP